MIAGGSRGRRSAEKAADAEHDWSDAGRALLLLGQGLLNAALLLLFPLRRPEIAQVAKFAVIAPDAPVRLVQEI